MRALLSVYDKTGITELARELHELGVELISSGGTANLLAAAGLQVTEPVCDRTLIMGRHAGLTEGPQNGFDSGMPPIVTASGRLPDHFRATGAPGGLSAVEQ